MYAKLNNGVVEKYPYTIGDLRKDNPNTSFPANIPPSTLADYGVVTVVVTGQPEIDYTKNITEGTPEFDGTQWNQVWVVADATTEEIEQRTQDQASSVRAQRDQLLAECDWIVIKAYETNTNVPAQWEIYRQALRDVPAQAGFPWDVVWPVKPA